jgi:hypothetical protein
LQKGWTNPKDKHRTHRDGIAPSLVETLNPAETK